MVVPYTTDFLEPNEALTALSQGLPVANLGPVGVGLGCLAAATAYYGVGDSETTLFHQADGAREADIAALTALFYDEGGTHETDATSLAIYDAPKASVNAVVPEFVMKATDSLVLRGKVLYEVTWTQTTKFQGPGKPPIVFYNIVSSGIPVAVAPPEPSSLPAGYWDPAFKDPVNVPNPFTSKSRSGLMTGRARKQGVFVISSERSKGGRPTTKEADVNCWDVVFGLLAFFGPGQASSLNHSQFHANSVVVLEVPDCLRVTPLPLMNLSPTGQLEDCFCHRIDYAKVGGLMKASRDGRAKVVELVLEDEDATSDETLAAAIRKLREAADDPLQRLDARPCARRRFRLPAQIGPAGFLVSIHVDTAWTPVQAAATPQLKLKKHP